MKTLLTLLSGLLIMSSSSIMANDVKEMYLEELFVIENGYDSNDDIEITVHGQLPNACYKIHNVEVTKQSTFQYDVKAYMKRKNLSGCVEEIINSPVNFSRTLALGELTSGTYSFNFNSILGATSKKMHIKQAMNNTIDDSLYAPISSAFIPELLFTNNRAQVVLTGIFHSNCFKLDAKDIKVVQENNVFIIIPKSKVLTYSQCKNKRFPIRQIVDLGKISAAGHYLIHIRSLSGLSVNKVFHVEDNQFTNRSSF